LDRLLGLLLQLIRLLLGLVDSVVDLVLGVVAAPGPRDRRCSERRYPGRCDRAPAPL
jgi:hypothetical protein